MGNVQICDVSIYIEVARRATRGGRRSNMNLIGIAVAAVLALTSGVAVARELPAELRALIEGLQAHRRVALAYLRTQNNDLAAVEIEDLRDRLAADRKKLSASALSDAALAVAIRHGEAAVSDSLKAVNAGDLERAHTLLQDANRPLGAWRKANGIRIFSDCIMEISAAYQPLDRLHANPPSLSDSQMGQRIVDESSRVVAILDRCEREAAEDVRREPEFTRLFDGMRHSLRQMPAAVAARDDALLQRLIGEQRSLEQLLTFRFG
jgi:hypothetical protein